VDVTQLLLGVFQLEDTRLEITNEQIDLLLRELIKRR
jgi:hypothetical protein